MLPSVFTENLFDEMFDDMFNNMMPMVAGRRNPLYGKHSKNQMCIRDRCGTIQMVSYN